MTIYNYNIISCADYNDEMERVRLWDEFNDSRGYGPVHFTMEDVLNNMNVYLQGSNPDECLLNFDLNRAKANAKTNFEERSNQTIGEARNSLMNAIDSAEDILEL